MIQCLQLNAGWDPSTARVLVRRFIDSECIGLGDAAVQGSMEPDRIEEDVDEEERAGGAGASRCVNYQREYPRIPLADSKGGLEASENKRTEKKTVLMLILSV